MKTVKELQGLLAQKQAELAELFAKCTKADGSLDMTQAQVDDAKARNTEMTAIGRELDDAKALDEVYQKSAEYVRNQNRAASNLDLGAGKIREPGQGNPDYAGKTLGKLFVEHSAFKDRQANGEIKVNLRGVNMKTLFATTAGFAPESTRTGKIVDYAMRRPTVADLIPQTQHEEAAVVYMEETTFTNAADTTAEAGDYPESALAYLQRTVAMFKISTFLPVTDEQMRYEAQAQSLVDNRLTVMLKLKEEDKILSGTGGGTDIDGFLHLSGVQSQAKGTDPVPDALYKAITKVRATGFAEPSGFAMHPNDWQDIRLLRTTDGIYIWGSPADAGPERIWGLPGIITTAETENTALLGDFQLYSELFRGSNVEIKVSDSHSDYFVKGKQAIRADEYLTLAIYRASAFCKVTGI